LARVFVKSCGGFIKHEAYGPLCVAAHANEFDALTLAAERVVALGPASDDAEPSSQASFAAADGYTMVIEDVFYTPQK